MSSTEQYYAQPHQPGHGELAADQAPRSPPVPAAAVKDKPSEYESAETGGLKRKASRDDEHDGDSPKRTRHGDDAGGPGARSPSPPAKRPSIGGRHDDEAATARRPATLEDKRRGRRLFGGLLSTLSQTDTNPQQKRRQEIERRQQDRLLRQREDEDGKRQERLAHLRRVRGQEQARFDRQVMDNRHAKMAWAARHLRTKAKPHIYYRPYRLTKEQERTIEDQIREVRRIAKRERGGDAEEPEQPEQRGRHVEGDDERLASPPRGAEAGREEGSEVVADEDHDQSATGRMDKDHHDDVVLEADEDTLIY